MRNDYSQILLPKTVFIGDRAELHITVYSDTNITAGPLPLSGFTRDIDESAATINSLRIAKNDGTTYDLTIDFTPWIPGFIEFPVYNITTGDGDPIKVTFSPVEIQSILETQGATTLKPSMPVKFLPGTVYKIWGGVIFLLLLVLTLIRLIVKRKEVALFLKNQKLKRFYKKNRKLTEAAIYRAKKSVDPIGDKAAFLQNTMRTYLEKRFDYPFTRIETSRIMWAFDQIYQGLLSDEKYDAVEDLSSFFIRTDFLRYGRPESEATENALYAEAQDLCERLMNIIDVLESPSQEISSEKEEEPLA